MKKILFLLLMSVGMFGNAQIKISALPAGTDTPALSVVIPGVQSGITKKFTLQKIQNAIGSSFTPANTAWGLTGNAGIDPNVNYLGTTDSTALNVYSRNKIQFFSDTLFMGYSDSSGIDTAGSIDHFFIANKTDRTIQIGDLGNGFLNSTCGSNYDDSLNIITFNVDSSFTVGSKTVSNVFSVNPTIGLVDIAVDIRIHDGTEGAGKVLTSDATGLAIWDTTSFTPLDSVSIYAITPTPGTSFYCTDCTGEGVTGRIVSFFGAAWRRLLFED